VHCYLFSVGTEGLSQETIAAKLDGEDPVTIEG